MREAKEPEQPVRVGRAQLVAVDARPVAVGGPRFADALHTGEPLQLAVVDRPLGSEADRGSLRESCDQRSGGVGRRFSDEEWLTPMQIARKLGYATDKPVRNAIKRGELKATHAPCRRKLIVAESEVLRWIDIDLAYEPVILDAEPPPSVAPTLNGHARRRRQLRTLDYHPSGGD